MPAIYTYDYVIAAPDLEPVYLHVNHARALTLLEKARVEFFATLGHPCEDLIARDVFPVVAGVEIEYKRELLAGPVVITCEQARVEGKSIWLTQRMLNARDKEAVVARFDLKFMSGSSKRAVPVPVEVEGAITRFFA